MIPRPTYPSNFNFLDEDCNTIANYLFNEVNTTFKSAYNNNNIIKTYRAFNDLTIILGDYPCLKVYKNNETPFTSFSKPSSTEYSIVYVIANSNNQQVASDVSSFVAKEIVRLLVNQQFNDTPLFQLDTDRQIGIEYERFIDPASKIFLYATITCNIFSY